MGGNPEDRTIDASVPAWRIVLGDETVRRAFTDYKTLYHQLFNSVTDCISSLQAAQRCAEEFYIEHSKQVRLLEGMEIIKRTEDFIK